ncbi:MAG: hypothetical protein ACI85K_000779 [Hyphomicrobiaceae bacterium]|jgi:hypothetical protein
MHNFTNDDAFTASNQQDLLDDLDMRCLTNVASIREAAATHTQARVEVRAGNACDREGVLSVLKSSEVNATTMTGIATKPVMVGSVFHLQFDQRILDIPPTLAICYRCTMLSDASFELRMRFTQPVEICSS